MPRRRKTIEQAGISVTAMIPFDQVRRLDELADEELSTRSHIVRKAVSFYLSNVTHVADTQRSDTALTAAD